MTNTASKIAAALKLTGTVVYGRKLDGPGPATLGWYVFEPCGRWRWLGRTAASLLRAAERYYAPNADDWMPDDDDWLTDVDWSK